MKSKSWNLTRLERVTLLLTVIFIAGTLVWFLTDSPKAPVVIETDHSLRTVETPERPDAPGILEGEVLDLNTASEGDLTRLPGIGPKRAAAIVAYREEKGNFSKTEELMEIDGIGDATYQQLAPYVTVGPAEEGDAHGEDSGG